MASIYTYSNPLLGRFSSPAPHTDVAESPSSCYGLSSGRPSSKSEHASHAHYRHRLNTHLFPTPALLRANTSPTSSRPRKTLGMPLPMPLTQCSRSPIIHHARHTSRAREKELAAAYARQTANEMADVSVKAAFAVIADTKAADIDAANILVDMMNDFGVGEGKKDE